VSGNDVAVTHLSFTQNEIEIKSRDGIMKDLWVESGSGRIGCLLTQTGMQYERQAETQRRMHTNEKHRQGSRSLRTDHEDQV
jgi:hypothetical protein